MSSYNQVTSNVTESTLIRQLLLARHYLSDSGQIIDTNTNENQNQNVSPTVDSGSSTTSLFAPMVKTINDIVEMANTTDTPTIDTTREIRKTGMGIIKTIVSLQSMEDQDRVNVLTSIGTELQDIQQKATTVKEYSAVQYLVRFFESKKQSIQDQISAVAYMIM
jgi:hypothetical protein